MKQYTNAILWPANLKEAGPDMPREEADVEENLRFLRKMGAVYWDSAAKRKELKGPFDGYIYITVPVGKVMYKCKVDWVINRNNLLQMEKEHKYIPKFREQCLRARFRSGKEHNPSPTWIKISKIERLKTPRELSDFEKLDGTPVENVRGGFVYIISH